MAASEIPLAALLDALRSIERRLDRQQDTLLQAYAAQSAGALPPAFEGVDAFLDSYFGSSSGEVAGAATTGGDSDRARSAAAEPSGSGSATQRQASAEPAPFAAVAGALEDPAPHELRRQHSAPAGRPSHRDAWWPRCGAALSEPVLALSPRNAGPRAAPLGCKRHSEPLAAVADVGSGTAGSPGEPLDRHGGAVQHCKRSRSSTADFVAGEAATPTFPPWLLQRACATLAPLSCTAAAALRAQQHQLLLGKDATGLPLPSAPCGAPGLLPMGLSQELMAGVASMVAPSSAAATAAAAAAQLALHSQTLVQAERTLPGVDDQAPCPLRRRPAGGQPRRCCCAAPAASPDAASTAAAAAAVDDLLSDFWEARGVFERGQRAQLVRVAKELGGLGDGGGVEAAWLRDAAAPLAEGALLPGVPATWAVDSAVPEIAAVSRRLVSLHALLGGGADVDVIWMVTREPRLLAASRHDMMARLMAMRLASARVPGGVDVVKLVEAQPALLLGGEPGADWAALSGEELAGLVQAWEHGVACDGDPEWRQRLAQLRVYRAAHGDTGAGFRSGDDPGLARWAAKQRRQLARGTLPEARAAALEELGFEADEDEAEWLVWFLELARFKEAHGHASPLSLSGGADFYLINWCSVQRVAAPRRLPCAVAAAAMADSAAWQAVKPYVNGGASGMMATCLIQPIDMVKVRLQLGATGGPLGVARDIIAKDGFSSLYRGLSAGLLRQATYTTARLGIFSQLTEAAKSANGGKNLPLWQKAACGLAAGGLGALVGTPADLTLIRMQADSTLPVDQRRNYKGVGDAMVRIVREDGVAGLFRGGGPTVVRAMALNMGMLASNDQAKEMIEAAGFTKGGSVAVLGGSMIAGFFASACSLPFDFVKTRMQRMTPNADGTMPYRGPVDCALQTLRSEGPLKFYTGFPTYLVRALQALPLRPRAACPARMAVAMSQSSSMADNPVWKAVKPYVNGGLSGMGATCLIQPVDMVKVRLQLGATGGPLGVARDIIAKDGFGSLYKGLSAGLLRQATYTTARLGIFSQLTEAAKSANGGKNLPLWQKAACGLAAGGLGALVGTPADLTLIRMQADSTLPVDQRRNYKGVGDAMVRIVREDGVAGLFRGGGPTVVRAMALNMGMLASNDQAKEMIEAAGFTKGGSVAVLGGSMIAGFFASACSLPFDFVKTRMQRMTPNADGTMPYRGPVDCALQTLRSEGPLKFYTGFPTYLVRIAPHAMFTLLFLDALPKLEKQIGLFLGGSEANDQRGGVPRAMGAARRRWLLLALLALAAGARDARGRALLQGDVVGPALAGGAALLPTAPLPTATAPAPAAASGGGAPGLAAPLNGTAVPANASSAAPGEPPSAASLAAQQMLGLLQQLPKNMSLFAAPRSGGPRNWTLPRLDNITLENGMTALEFAKALVTGTISSNTADTNTPDRGLADVQSGALNINPFMDGAAMSNALTLAGRDATANARGIVFGLVGAGRSSNGATALGRTGAKASTDTFVINGGGLSQNAMSSNLAATPQGAADTSVRAAAFDIAGPTATGGLTNAVGKKGADSAGLGASMTGLGESYGAQLANSLAEGDTSAHTGVIAGTLTGASKATVGSTAASLEASADTQALATAKSALGSSTAKSASLSAAALNATSRVGSTSFSGVGNSAALAATAATGLAAAAAADSAAAAQAGAANAAALSRATGVTSASASANATSQPAGAGVRRAPVLATQLRLPSATLSRSSASSGGLRGAGLRLPALPALPGGLPLPLLGEALASSVGLKALLPSVPRIVPQLPTLNQTITVTAAPACNETEINLNRTANQTHLSCNATANATAPGAPVELPSIGFFKNLQQMHKEFEDESMRPSPSPAPAAPKKKAPPGAKPPGAAKPPTPKPPGAAAGAGAAGAAAAAGRRPSRSAGLSGKLRTTLERRQQQQQRRARAAAGGAHRAPQIRGALPRQLATRDARPARAQLSGEGSSEGSCRMQAASSSSTSAAARRVAGLQPWRSLRPCAWTLGRGAPARPAGAVAQQARAPCPAGRPIDAPARHPGGAPPHARRGAGLACAAAAAAATPLPAGDDDAAAAGGVAKLLAHVRAALFAAWTFALAVPLFIAMLCLCLPVMALDNTRRLAQHYVNNLWAIASTTPFYSVEVVGRENLPPPGAPAVYVANHQSFMDIYSLFHLRRPFKFISKTSNFLIPIVGWSMFLTGHIMLNRVDRRSQLKCLQTCITLLGAGASCLFFPEGTRSKDCVLGGFKKGAFSVAVKAGAPVVPITLLGTGRVMPAGREGQMFGGRVRIVVHPPIPAAGRGADKVCEEARAAVASALPPELVGADSVTDSM
ncbi:1-acyl-sn-glycerol-3-phosphate acyltransferase [Scenedesmus sp. PABB004]|nr:1-acyl-sn-glycerol-3-phosphate acyltransferase [Scenedesmus sp. PABB004]